MIAPIIKTITVPCTPEKAFKIFVEDIGTWWPLTTHAISPGNDEIAETVTVEGIVGGDIYETSNTGTRHNWGKVTVFEPGKTFAMTWHLSNPPSLGTLVTVTFSDNKSNGTDVMLRHDNWDALGKGASEKREQYDGGWVGVLNRYTNACQD